MDVQEQIAQLVKDNRVLLFMKGTADAPRCGFSMRASQIVKALDVPFETVDVLESDAIRQGIKVFSNWPTIPQLYIDGQFVGGTDITMEMWESGDLQKLVAGHKQPVS